MYLNYEKKFLNFRLMHCLLKLEIAERSYNAFSKQTYTDACRMLTDESSLYSVKFASSCGC